MNLLISIVVVLACTSAFWILWTYAFGAGWQPTPTKVVWKMLTLAKTKPSDVVYDLGAGDGRILVTASKNFGARSVGIEIDPLRFFWAKTRIALLGLNRLSKVEYGNVYHKDLKEATVVTLFLSGRANAKLKSKLNKLRPGTRVVSYWHPIESWAPCGIDHDEKIYLYKIPR